MDTWRGVVEGERTRDKTIQRELAVENFTNAEMSAQRLAPTLHAVPDRSIVHLAIDLSDLEGTNIHLGEAEVIAPHGHPASAVESLVGWLRKGCHATMIPVDGQDSKQLVWLREVLSGIVSSLNTTSSLSKTTKTGLVWKRIDGLDTDLLEEYMRDMETSFVSRKDSWLSQASQLSARGRPDSGRIKPRAIVCVHDEDEVNAVLDECIIGRYNGREQVKEDCMVSIVFHDEQNCLFSMLHVALARTRLSFLNLASLVEEIGQLHAAGQAGDFRLKSAEITELNALAANYLRGDSKLLVVAYPQCEDFSYVSKIVSVCASSQTVWTDLIWMDVDVVRRAASAVSWEARSGSTANGSCKEEAREAQEGLHEFSEGDGYESENEVTYYEVDTTQKPLNPSYGVDHHDQEEGSLASCFRSPTIASIRQSLQERVVREMSTAAKQAVSRIEDEESPTGASPSLPGPSRAPENGSNKSLTERRLLFPSLCQSHNGSAPADREARESHGNQSHDVRQSYMDQRSRDVFSSLRTIDIENKYVYDDPNVESISLQRPTSNAEELDLESDDLKISEESLELTVDNEEVTRPTPMEVIAAKEVFRSIEEKINDRFSARIKDLEERLEISELRRIELQSSYDVLKDGPQAGWDFSDHESLIKSLQEEVKRCKSLEAAMSSMKQEELERDVEMEAKDKEIHLLRARIHALESDSDVSTAYKLCEEALKTSQEENRVLQQENADLLHRIAAMEVSNLMAANGVSAILPEDEDYDVDGAEARIIYKLHEKLKVAMRRTKRLEAEKEELRSKLQEGKRGERVTIVTKNVCEKLKMKVNSLQSQLDDLTRERRKTTPTNATKEATHGTVRSIDVRCF